MHPFVHSTNKYSGSTFSVPGPWAWSVILWKSNSRIAYHRDPLSTIALVFLCKYLCIWHVSYQRQPMVIRVHFELIKIHSWFYCMSKNLRILHFLSVQFSSVAQSCPIFATPWTAARQTSLSITNSQSLPKPMSIELVMPPNHLILCCPLLLLPSIFPSIKVFSNESAFHIRWPKYWSFSFNISPSNEHPGLISFRMDWLDLLEVQETLKSRL